jgi:hypothetical protein
LSDKTQKTRRLIPLLVVLGAAILGFVFLRDYLSFTALTENREALETYRDRNYPLTVFVFIAAYVVIVAFSLPGATVATLTGGSCSGFSRVFSSTLSARQSGPRGFFWQQKPVLAIAWLRGWMHRRGA